MSPTSIIVIGAIVAAAYFLGSIFVGPERHDSRAQRLRDVIATVVVFSGYTAVAVTLYAVLPGPIMMLAAIALLAAVTWTYSYYRIRRTHRDGAGPI